MKLTERLRTVGAYAIGNRVSLLGKVLLMSGAIGYFNGINPSNENLENSIRVIYPTEKFLLDWLFLIQGTFLSSVTLCGASCGRFYNRTRDHIKKRGELDPRFVKKVMEGWETNLLFGYCQKQGIYLAARDYGQLETFNDVRKENSRCIIPHI